MDRLSEERWRRQRLLAAAYVYEITYDSPIMSDPEFDQQCLAVDLSLGVDPATDVWWRENFKPSTGMWIHRYKDTEELDRLVKKFRE